MDVIGLGVLLIGLLYPLRISFQYFRELEGRPLDERLMASVHGACVAIVMLLFATIGMTRFAEDSRLFAGVSFAFLGTGFVSMLFSLIYLGPFHAIHLSHLITLFFGLILTVLTYLIWIHFSF